MIQSIFSSAISDLLLWLS